MFIISKYKNMYYDIFIKMLGACFNKDYKILLTKQQLEELCKEITQQVNKQIAFLDLLFLDDDAKGFVNYQVDTHQSDWCEKETWGCIRELYVADDVRGQGYGRKLAEHAEKKLLTLSVPNIYLTTDDAIDFWVKIGYRDTGEICAKNEGNILIKAQGSGGLSARENLKIGKMACSRGGEACTNG